MREPARATLAVASLCALVLLRQVAPGGGWALGCGVLLFALGALLTTRRVSRRRGLDPREDLHSLLLVGGGVLGVGVSVATLIGGDYAGHGLAWLARTLLLLGLLALPHVRLRWLPVHGLALLLALWSAAAFHDADHPALLPLALAGLTLGLGLQGLLFAHEAELSRSTSASITTGVAPTPWGLRPHHLPALLVLLVALVPLAAHWSLPRLDFTPRRMPASSGPARTPRDALLAPQEAGWEVGFSPSLRMDEPRAATMRGDTELMRVTAKPGLPALYLRGAALPIAGELGFFPSQRRLLEPPLREPRTQTLAVELLSDQEGTLFADGRPSVFRGVRPRFAPRGVLAPRGARYPLRYEVDCELASADLDPYDLRPFLDELDVLRLPASLRDDPELRKLAERVAWGNSVHGRVQSAIRYLQHNGEYTLRRTRPAGLDLYSVVTRFLREDKRGVCEEFAVSCAVLLRLVDVPARVVTGFRTIERDDEGRFRVRARHAHAWIEVAYEGAGWVGYEPTPPLPGSSGLPGGGRISLPAPQPSPSPPAEGQEAKDPSQVRPGGVVLPRGALQLGVLAGLALLALWALLGPARLRRELRERQLRRAGVVAPELRDLRQRLFDLLAARGFPLDGSQTPQEFLAEREEQGPAEPRLRAAVEHYTHLRFSGPDPVLRVALGAALERLERGADEQTRPSSTSA